MKKYGQNMASAATSFATTERKRSSTDDLFCAYCPKTGRPWVSWPVFQKSQVLPLFIYNLFTFPTFSIFSRKCHCPAGRVIETRPICPYAPCKCGRPAGDRDRPSFRSVRPYANFLLLLAVGYMRSIFPGTRPPDREFAYGKSIG
jgi:hypothetical protein